MQGAPWAIQTAPAHRNSYSVSFLLERPVFPHPLTCLVEGGNNPLPSLEMTCIYCRGMDTHTHPVPPSLPGMEAAGL